MLFDKYGMVNMEQNPVGNPGRTGDSFAETFRYGHLEFFLHLYGCKYGISVLNSYREKYTKIFEKCHTKEGLLRHPETPWRENDFPGDQWLPGYLCLRAWGLTRQADVMTDFLYKNKYRYGNGDFVHPTILCAIERANDDPDWWEDTAIFAQAAAMRFFPWSWNDGKKKFEESSKASADYLNFFHLLMQCEYAGHTWVSRRAKGLIGHGTMMSKIASYYEPEPNKLEIIALYTRAVKKVYGINECLQI